MKPYFLTTKNEAQYIKILLIHISLISFLTGCVATGRNDNGITFIDSLGTPPVDTISWSPTDDNKILVTAGNIGQGQSEIYVLNFDNGKKQMLATTKYGDFVSSTWSPDSNSALLLVRESTKGFEPGGLWILDISNVSARYFIDGSHAAWSPDGKTIAAFFVESDKNRAKKIQLRLIDIITKSEKILYTNENAKYLFGLTWSPDGKYLAFSIGEVELSDLYVMDLTDHKIVRITNGERNYSPVWSPKGNIIAYEHWPSTGINSTLHLINLDGSCDTEIPTLENVWSPTWSPDGKRLAYVGSDGIYFLEINKLLGKDIYQNLCP